MKRRHIYLLLSLITLIAASCVRRPLELYNEGVSRVRINMDWTTSFGFVPKTEDISLCLYRDGDNIYRRMQPTSPYTQVVQLPIGRYYLMVYTPEDDWTGSARFETSNYTLANCRAEPITTRSFQSWDAGTQYMCDPINPIGVAVDTFEITPDMVNQHIKFYDYRDYQERDTADYEYNEVIDPMTTRLYVRILLHGFRSLRSIEANISGMADGFWMNRVDRTYETGTLLLPHENWSATPMGEADNAWNARVLEQTPDSINYDEWGYVTTSIDTYGLPLGKERMDWRDSTDNVLNMAFLLVDGTIRTYKFNVGKRMIYRTPSGDALSKAEVLKHIEVEIILDDPTIAPDLPPVDPTVDGASGFNAHVDEWEFGGTFDVGLSRQSQQRQEERH